MKGRPPKPTVLPFASAKSNPPICPSYLPEDAKKIWKRLVKAMDSLGIITLADQDILAMYCQTFVRWRQAEETVDREGQFFTMYNDDGSVKYAQIHPACTAASKEKEMLNRLGSSLGLNPVARRNLSIAVATEDDNQAAAKWKGIAKD